jgi:DHA2 family multidrug resistance protein
MRNLGASIGISVMNAMVTQGAQFHHARLAESASEYNPLWVAQLQQLQQSFIAAGMSAPEASQAALARMARAVAGQAQALSYIDAFWVLGLAVLLLWPLAFLMRDLPKGGKARAH